MDSPGNVHVMLFTDLNQNLNEESMTFARVIEPSVLCSRFLELRVPFRLPVPWVTVSPAIVLCRAERTGESLPMITHLHGKVWAGFLALSFLVYVYNDHLIFPGV